uniref:Uncharacterized protein n=1 Tax=Cacopsylla melanoneura TaxID=428564 RepID=A0A8D8R515_9HEMI
MKRLPHINFIINGTKKRSGHQKRNGDLPIKHGMTKVRRRHIILLMMYECFRKKAKRRERMFLTILLVYGQGKTLKEPSTLYSRLISRFDPFGPMSEQRNMHTERANRNRKNEKMS